MASPKAPAQSAVRVLRWRKVWSRAAEVLTKAYEACLDSLRRPVTGCVLVHTVSNQSRHFALFLISKGFAHRDFTDRFDLRLPELAS